MNLRLLLQFWELFLHNKSWIFMARKRKGFYTNSLIGWNSDTWSNLEEIRLGLQPLIDVVEKNSTLKAVNLETNYLSGDFFAKLFQAALKNQTLEEVKAVNQVWVLICCLIDWHPSDNNFLFESLASVVSRERECDRGNIIANLMPHKHNVWLSLPSDARDLIRNSLQDPTINYFYPPPPPPSVIQ